MQSKTGIIYLQRDKFQVYSPYLPNLYEFRFVPELIRDFDLINKELLENLLKVFVANNKIPASGMLIVVADNASFIKDFTSTVPQNPQGAATPPQTLEDLQNLANQYIEQVPFEVVSGKTFPLATGVRAYATNEEVFESIKSVLEKLGFIIEAVIPGFAFGPEISNKPALDATAITLILQKVSTVSQYNLLKESTQLSSSSPSEDVDEKGAITNVASTPQETKNKKLTIIIAVSVLLLVFGVTGFILYQQFTTPPYKPPPVTNTPPAAPTSVPSPTQSAEGTVETKTLTVQIVNPPSAVNNAEAIRAALVPLGFKSVELESKEALGASQSIVIFSSKVSAQTKTDVTENVKKVVGDVVVQDKPDAAFDVIITLVK